MKTLYLHIGTPKTATTAIQVFCRDNRQVLQEHGYCFPIFDFTFPDAQKERNGHFLVGKAYLQPQERNFAEEDQVLQEGFAQVLDAFEQYDNVILSDEGVWNHGFGYGGRCWNKVREELEKGIFKAKVVVYLRRQDDFVYSWWNQVVKEGFHKSSVITWEEMVSKLPVVQLDYYERLEKIAKIVGKENIIVRKFDRSQFVGQAIQADFLDAVGLEFSEEYQILTETTNNSLTRNCNEIKRILNGLPELDRKRNSFFRTYLSEYSIQAGDDKNSSMMSGQELKEFMAKYEEGNRKIAREYMDGQERLFDENYQAKEKWNPVNPAMIEDIVSLFGTTTISLLKKNEELERQVSTLRYKIKHPWHAIGDKIKSFRNEKKTQ